MERSQQVAWWILRVPTGLKEGGTCQTEPRHLHSDLQAAHEETLTRGVSSKNVETEVQTREINPAVLVARLHVVSTVVVVHRLGNAAALLGSARRVRSNLLGLLASEKTVQDANVDDLLSKFENGLVSSEPWRQWTGVRGPLALVNASCCTCLPFSVQTCRERRTELPVSTNEPNSSTTGTRFEETPISG